MRFVFRADASLEMGSGHAMRCSAIAEYARSIGIETILAGSLGGISWLEDRFLKIGCRVSPVSEFQGLDGQDILILDSYEIQPGDEFLLRWNWKSQVILADSMSPIQTADLVIHPGLSVEWFRGDLSKLLYGPRYIPFRSSIKKNQKEFSSKVDKLIVFGGGTDLFNFAEEMAKTLCDLKGFNEVIFFSNANQGIEQRDIRFKVLAFGEQLDDELNTADLVFTTASTSSLEIVAREIPLGVACSVENQRTYYDSLCESKVAAQLGERIDSVGWNLDKEIIRRLVINNGLRESLRSECRNFLDLNGAQRIVGEILRI